MAQERVGKGATDVLFAGQFTWGEDLCVEEFDDL